MQKLTIPILLLSAALGNALSVTAKIKSVFGSSSTKLTSVTCERNLKALHCTVSFDGPLPSGDNTIKFKNQDKTTTVWVLGKQESDWSTVLNFDSTDDIVKAMYKGKTVRVIMDGIPRSIVLWVLTGK